ncbi:DUF4192 domain-containing protein [Nonomuraea polychroma]|uniref:DUF4192 domain-containing protein n=1 Tax=Nonomuraea polychroma TaxID=46176 RepID=UPI003D8AE4BC
MALPDSPRIHASTPGDFVAVVPHILGYQPHHEIVIIFARRGLAVATLTTALPVEDPHEWNTVGISEARKAATQSGADGFFLIGYGPGDMVTPAVDLLTAPLAAFCDVWGLFRVFDGRYHLYGPPESATPPDGIPIPVNAATVTAAVYEGLTAHASRDDMMAAVQPISGSERHASDYHALAACLTLVGDMRAHGYSRNLTPTMSRARQRVSAAAAPYRARGRLDDDDLAHVALAVHIPPVCGEAVARMGVAASRGAHDELITQATLWLDVMRRCHRQLAAPPAFLCAVAAYLQSHTRHATFAVNYALDVQPTFTYALWLKRQMDHMMPPPELAAKITTPVADLRDRYAVPRPEWIQPMLTAIENVCGAFPMNVQLDVLRLVPTFPSGTRELLPPPTVRCSPLETRA